MHRDTPKKKKRILVLLATTAILALLLCPFVGMRAISPAALLQATKNDAIQRIFWTLRVPRVLTAFLAGAGLSLGGLCFQAMFRNALATPFTLGVASGASLGVALCVRLGLLFSLFGVPGNTVFAFAGAILAVGTVYGLTRLRGGCSTTTMLLAGVAISFFFSSLILFLQYISDFTDTFRIVRWLMGGVEAAGYHEPAVLAAFLAVGAALVALHRNELDLLTVGEEFALSRGVNVNRVKLSLFLAVSFLIAGVVALCGPIGFVGMICPHICRLLLGPGHRRLIPAALLTGGAGLTLCDTLARTLVAPVEIPVGVVTALIGGPFFLWLLLSRSRAGEIA
jgi:iron complex transport system permease protein